ncbi:MAG: hypothetical protein GC208_03010 [Alphaproteobacteria bacterium]|nr:hypothetical protein [Alphaproteobacteria bacterium]
MTKHNTAGAFKTPRPSAHSRAQATDIAVKTILEEESAKRQSLMRQQRAARLARDAETVIVPDAPKTKKPRASRKKAVSAGS